MSQRMTRQELIDNAIVGVGDLGLPLRRYQYNAYQELCGTNLPPWEEMVIQQKPWLATEESYNEFYRERTPEEKERTRAECEAERAKYPTMATVYVPFLGKKLMVPGFRYSDGCTSRAMMTNPEWNALSEERRQELTVNEEYLEGEATVKANEIDIVELTETVQDVPKGTHCTVVVAFEKPSEAYDLEWVHESGEGTLIYSVRPEQFKVVKRYG